MMSVPRELQPDSLDPCSVRILDSVRQIIRAVDMDSRRLILEHRITAPQLMCLRAVIEKGSTTASGIARRIHVSQSTLVGILDRLEIKGLIERSRSTEDRREYIVTPTEEGRHVVGRVPFPLQHTLGRALIQLSEEDRLQTAAVFERLVELIGAAKLDTRPLLEIGWGGAVEEPSAPEPTGHKSRQPPGELRGTPGGEIVSKGRPHGRRSVPSL
jgi:DNA-binding MarR family transcriptional regulator